VNAALPLLGIFVGGASSRMGGAPKGLLRVPTGETIVERWRALGAGAGLSCVLVGEAEAYAPLGLEAIADLAPGAGPLGGLAALMRRAPKGRVIAVGCDMPHVTPPLLERLMAADVAAAAVAPFRDGRFEPLFARYESARVLPEAERRIAAGELSLQGLLRAVGAAALSIADVEWPLLADWDAPADITP